MLRQTIVLAALSIGLAGLNPPVAASTVPSSTEPSVYVQRALPLFRGYHEGFPRAVNDVGVVAGELVAFDDGRALPVTWRNGKVRALKLPPKTVSGSAFDINDHGDVVGRASRKGQNASAIAWIDGSPRWLDSPPTALTSEARGINELGQITGYVQMPAGVPGGGMALWSRAGTLLRIGQPYYGEDINESGTVAGSTPSTAGPDVACLWTPSGELQLLPPASEQGTAYASAINDSNRVVGAAVTSTGGGYAPASWRLGNLTLLPLPADALSGVANGVNNVGQAVGAAVGASSTDAFIWTSDDDFHLIAKDAAAIDINEDGLVVGVTNGGGQYRPVVWQR